MREATQVTHALGGKWYGCYGIAACPVCQPEGRKDQNALTISLGRKGILLHCKKSNCSKQALDAAIGLEWRFAERPFQADYPKPAAQHTKKNDYARKIWDEGQSLAGSVAETYLRDARGVTAALPASLRYHPAAWHGPLRRSFPAMISLVEGGDGFSINRTFLRCDGSGKADIPKELQKMRLGSSKGGHVPIANGSGPLVVAEGIETALSLPELLSAADATVWATLSASLMRSLALPSVPGQLIIAADGDPEGRASAHKLAVRARSLGWGVETKAAPEGLDWNDVLLTTRSRRHC